MAKILNCLYVVGVQVRVYGRNGEGDDAFCVFVFAEVLRLSPRYAIFMG